jgi:hypothetical protein
MKKTIFLAIIIVFSISHNTSAQIGIGYNTDGNTLLISTNPLHKFWGEFRINTKPYNQASWSYNDRGIMQLYMEFNIYSSKNVSLYTGGGLGVNFLTEGSDNWISANIPLGIKMNPINALPDLYLVGEYVPMIVIIDKIPTIHCISLGFRYVLHKKE